MNSTFLSNTYTQGTVMRVLFPGRTNYAEASVLGGDDPLFFGHIKSNDVPFLNLVPSVVRLINHCTLHFKEGLHCKIPCRDQVKFKRNGQNAQPCFFLYYIQAPINVVINGYRIGGIISKVGLKINPV